MQIGGAVATKTFDNFQNIHGVLPSSKYSVALAGMQAGRQAVYEVGVSIRIPPEPGVMAWFPEFRAKHAVEHGFLHGL